ncbi:hypothetical protein [Anaerosporobacter sp.]|uniref:hypothetical protein n=1 Tax=Anaerosporobacter sp. TaxID=1872529 RepID=UPI00286F1637|nr:hypothetical protein [Anaerosporobacter sp.]
MKDYFEELVNKIHKRNDIIIVDKCILKHQMDYSFDLFEYGISDEVKYLYNNYKKFHFVWKEDAERIQGFIELVPYEEILDKHREINEIANSVEAGCIEEQEIVINDLKNWYPIFRFPNGDAFCYDKRNGKIAFWEHEVFDTGINLNGLIIAESIDYLLENWSKVLFVDIYDWYEGVNESGIDLSKQIYSRFLRL